MIMTDKQVEATIRFQRMNPRYWKKVSKELGISIVQQVENLQVGCLNMAVTFYEQSKLVNLEVSDELLNQLAEEFQTTEAKANGVTFEDWATEQVGGWMQKNRYPMFQTV